VTARAGAAAVGAAVILAGGRGRRLGGACKPLLLVDGRRIIDRQLAVLRPLFAHLAIAGDDAAAFAGALPVLRDRAGAGLGPLGGLDAALAWLPAEVSSVVCVAGDMPYLAPELLVRLRDADPAALAVVPRTARGLEPLCARYHRALAPAITRQLARGDRAMHALLGRVPCTFVEEPELGRLDPTGRAFVGINTPEDLVGR